MLEMAQLLRGAGDGAPDPPFVDRLRRRLQPQRRVSRRTAFFSGLGALAAGLLAGFGLDRAVEGTGSAAPNGWSEPLVTGGRGRWVPVVRIADLPEGAVHPFTVGAVQGFLVNERGSVRALSRICTHMGCALQFQRAEQAFVCPCHGAEFDMSGKLTYGPRGTYHLKLPPLPPIQARIVGEHIEILGV